MWTWFISKLNSMGIQLFWDISFFTVHENDKIWLIWRTRLGNMWKFTDWNKMKNGRCIDLCYTTVTTSVLLLEHNPSVLNICCCIQNVCMRIDGSFKEEGVHKNSTFWRKVWTKETWGRVQSKNTLEGEGYDSLVEDNGKEIWAKEGMFAVIPIGLSRGRGRET